LAIDNDSHYHNELIIDQFTKQAIPFTQYAAHSAEYAVKLLVTLSDIRKEDTVLEVAGGSGLVSCELAKVAHRITVIDRGSYRTTGRSNSRLKVLQLLYSKWKQNGGNSSRRTYILNDA
jgi:protein-L-isoaspartate O-methyltransferase